jgi:hypothetical protein
VPSSTELRKPYRCHSKSSPNEQPHKRAHISTIPDDNVNIASLNESFEAAGQAPSIVPDETQDAAPEKELDPATYLASIKELRATRRQQKRRIEELEAEMNRRSEIEAETKKIYQASLNAARVHKHRHKENWELAYEIDFQKSQWSIAEARYKRQLRDNEQDIKMKNRQLDAKSRQIARLLPGSYVRRSEESQGRLCTALRRRGVRIEASLNKETKLDNFTYVHKRLSCTT